MKLTCFRFLCLIALTSSTGSALTTPDRVLRGNMQVDYLRKPAEVTSWSEWLAQGTVYGRVRTHYFVYDWDTEKTPAAARRATTTCGGSAAASSGNPRGGRGGA